MKKIYKIMVFVLMLVLLASTFLVAPTSVFATSAVAKVGSSIVLNQMPKTGKVGDTISIPMGRSNTTGSVVSVKVTDPANNDITASLVENGNKYEFTATLAGNYKVVYTATSTDNTVQTESETYLIKITSDKAVLSFEDNSPFILQDKIGENGIIVLPYPTVTINDEKLAGHYAGEGTTNANIVVTVADPEKNINASERWTETTQDDVYTNPLGTITIDGKKYYTFTPSKKTVNGEQTTVFGSYVVYFKYTNTETNVVVTKAQTILVSQNYSVDNQKITFTWNGSMPESLVLGNETELPKPVTVDENKGGESVKTYTLIEISYTNGNNTQKVDVDGFKFTPMFEAKNGSYYTITYKIYTLEDLNLSNYTSLETALENAEPSVKKSYTILNATDTEKPVVKPVNAYEVQNNGLSNETIELLTEEDISYYIPTKVRTNVEVEIPAIYATDNFYNFGDLTLTRTLIDEDGKTYDLDGNSTLNESDSSLNPKVIQANNNQIAKIYFRANGTYTIRFRAVDKAGNRGEVTFKIVVTETLIDDLAPYIVLPTIETAVYPQDKISFAEPTIVDYKDDHEKGATTSTTIDSNVKKDVYYFYGKATADTNFAELLENNQLTKLQKTNGVYSLVVDENPATNYITIVVRAEDDAKYSTGRTENNVSYKFKVVQIYNVNDKKEPTLLTDLFEIADNLNLVYGQNETVNFVTDIEFTDEDSNNEDTTNNLIATVKVFNKLGNEINVSNVKFLFDGNKYIVRGGKFITNIAGEYQVVITATDLGGNSLINSFVFNVRDTKAPTIDVDKVQSTMELGKTYKLPTPVIKDDGVVIENNAYSQVEFGDDCPSYSFNQGTLEFTPREEGTFVYYYVGKDSIGNEIRVLGGTIEVKDTLAPVIVINETGEYSIPETAKYKDSNGNVVNVTLPLFTATDEYNGIKSTEITVKDPNGEELTVTTLSDHYEFTPNKNGIYSVTYKATDNANKTATEVYSIKVGDVSAPTLNGTTKPGSYKVDDTIKIDLANLTVVDDVDGSTNGASANNNGKLTLTLIGPDSKEISMTKTNNEYSHKFETAGKYTIKYTIKDTAGNTDSITYSFEVEATTTNKTVSEIAWGTALIIASIALVAGVIVFFVRTRDVPADKEKVEKKDEE